MKTGKMLLCGLKLMASFKHLLDGCRFYSVKMWRQTVDSQAYS